MGKNVIAETEGLKISSELVKVLAGLSVEDQAEISELAVEDQISTLELIASLAATSSVETGASFVKTKGQRDNLNIFIAGGIGLKAGTVIQAYLLGTYHVFSKAVKENWKEFIASNGELFFYNSYYKFSDLNGKEFGIWSYATLRDLEKIPTKATNPMVKANPLVKIVYHGKIEGKELLKQKYDIVLSKGNSAHVFETTIDGAASYDRYVKGCVNNLNRPTPTIGLTSSDITKEEASQLNFEKIMQAQQFVGYNAQ